MCSLFIRASPPGGDTYTGDSARRKHAATSACTCHYRVACKLGGGRQNWSQSDATAKPDNKSAAGDPETGKDLLGGGEYAELHFYGPRVDRRHMLEDLIRLNLFRKAEIHCIGIGEADPETLKAISNIGHGQLRIVGRK